MRKIFYFQKFRRIIKSGTNGENYVYLSDDAVRTGFLQRSLQNCGNKKVLSRFLFFWFITTQGVVTLSDESYNESRKKYLVPVLSKIVIILSINVIVKYLGISKVTANWRVKFWTILFSDTWGIGKRQVNIVQNKIGPYADDLPKTYVGGSFDSKKVAKIYLKFL